MFRVFRYVESLDAFIIDEQYKSIADDLGLTEWHSAVWVGRLFRLDNDVGEHWFDNWDERHSRELKAAELGIESDELMVVVPDRFADGTDGPCHTPEFRVQFWQDVLKSLRLSTATIAAKARAENEIRKRRADPTDPPIPDLEARIALWQTE